MRTSFGCAPRTCACACVLEMFQLLRDDPAWRGASVQLRIGSGDGDMDKWLDFRMQAGRELGRPRHIKSPRNKRSRNQVAGA